MSYIKSDVAGIITPEPPDVQCVSSVSFEK
jgi:hypothetical protein